MEGGWYNADLPPLTCEGSSPMPKVDKELRPIVKELQDAGYQVERAPGKGAHYIVKNNLGQRVFSLPSTPGRGRAIQNLRAALKRQGLLTTK